MSDVFQLLANPIMLKALMKLFLSYAVFMAFTGALPMPPQERGGFKRELYRFFFAFFNGLSINLHRAAKALKVPGAAE